MASCYGKISAPSGGVAQSLGYLPIRTKLPDDTAVEVDYFRESEHAAGHRLLNDVIEEGLSWPFEDSMDMEAFRAYFLSHAAFVVRVVLDPVSPAAPLPTATADEANLGREEGHQEDSSPSEAEAAVAAAAVAAAAVDASGGEVPSDGTSGGEGGRVDVWGAFYIKPNFPGRCSHVCNGGFITDPRRRRRGVARLMGHAFLRLAKDLGYRASYFNLVFRSNEASLQLWRSLGFTELAVVPKAGRLKGIEGLVDASQFYYDLDALRQEDLPEHVRGPA